MPVLTQNGVTLTQGGVPLSSNDDGGSQPYQGAVARLGIAATGGGVGRESAAGGASARLRLYAAGRGSAPLPGVVGDVDVAVEVVSTRHSSAIILSSLTADIAPRHVLAGEPTLRSPVTEVTMHLRHQADEPTLTRK